MLTSLGAQVRYGPTARVCLRPTDRTLEAELQCVIAEPPEITFVASALSLQSLFDAAAALGLAEPLQVALAQGEVVTADPEAADAAVLVGLERHRLVEPCWTIEQSGSRSAAAVLIVSDDDGFAGRGPNGTGGHRRAARVLRPFRWERPIDPSPAQQLIEAVAAGRVDAVTFTGRVSATNFVQISRELELYDEVASAFAGQCALVAVGPASDVVARELGVGRVLQPVRWQLGSMVRTLTSLFTDRGHDLAWPGGNVRVQGDHVWLGARDSPVVLTQRERAIMDALAERPGVVWSKERLLRQIWGGGDSDVHAVEVAVARLRKRLGTAGAMIETVTRRGYRLWIPR